MIRRKGLAICERLGATCHGYPRLLFHSSRQVAGEGYESSSGVQGLNHVAICVPSVREASKTFAALLGVPVTEPVRVENHGVTVSFVKLPNVNLELLEPLGDDSPVANFLAKHPHGGIHHLCFDVDSAHQSLERIKSLGKYRFLNSEPKIGSHGTPTFFMHPQDICGCLIEMEQIDPE
ncbi:hypothetical protein M9435_003507 [Picochlorum sp. BPE23]|nr:hypothetical protein M9435_003507 [Picochlorum sp. BPE23]